MAKLESTNLNPSDSVTLGFLSRNFSDSDSAACVLKTAPPSTRGEISVENRHYSILPEFPDSQTLACVLETAHAAYSWKILEENLLGNAPWIKAGLDQGDSPWFWRDFNCDFMSG